MMLLLRDAAFVSRRGALMKEAEGGQRRNSPKKTSN
jgi:hypothetical protein